MECALAAVPLVTSVLIACDSVSKVLLLFRKSTGYFEGLRREMSQLRVEIDTLNEVQAAITRIEKRANSDQRVTNTIQDSLVKFQVLGGAMSETIAAAGEIVSFPEKSSPAAGFRHSATTLEFSEWRHRVDRLDTCIESLREAASAVMDIPPEPDRPHGSPRGRPRRPSRPNPPNPIPLLPRPSSGEVVWNEKYPSQGRGGGDNGGTGPEDMSKLARCSLVAITAAGSSMMTAWDAKSYIKESVLRRVLLRPVLEQSLLSVLESPATLIFATAMTVTGLTTHHYLQRGHGHQDAWILGAVLVSVVIWVIGGSLVEIDGTSILLRVTPWCALLGMLMGGCSPMSEKASMGSRRDSWQLPDEKVDLDMKSLA
ncbi:hypothetical protein QBC39DRAFT_434588 [Podospora conica]|nr:hypothetical protein QBC39DRAFT_434588 [Schizothecium conicum]